MTKLEIPENEILLSVPSGEQLTCTDIGFGVYAPGAYCIDANILSPEGYYYWDDDDARTYQDSINESFEARLPGVYQVIVQAHYHTTDVNGNQVDKVIEKTDTVTAIAARPSAHRLNDGDFPEGRRCSAFDNSVAGRSFSLLYRR